MPNHDLSKWQDERDERVGFMEALASDRKYAPESRVTRLELRISALETMLARQAEETKLCPCQSRSSLRWL